jgi:hypothetical protein
MWLRTTKVIEIARKPSSDGMRFTYASYREFTALLMFSG